MEYPAQKIKQSATARRLKFLIVFFVAVGLVFIAAAIPCAIVGGAFFGILSVLFSAVSLFCLFLWLRFLTILRKIEKEAGRYAFSVTKTASFECFGPFLALNVTFFDGGSLREGRSRFLFGARDMEPWQNVSLEIGYKKFPDESGERDERIVVIGTAPAGGKDEKIIEKR